MSEHPSRQIATWGLVIGASLGMAGTFVPSAPLRGLLWGLDGMALIIATALLATHHFRRGNDMVAAGFLIFVVGETLIVAGSVMPVQASGPMFSAGAALWAASLALVSGPVVMPFWLRAVAVTAAVLFLFVAIHGFLGFALSPLDSPLPFFAYPFLAATLLGWAWEHHRSAA